jgi:FixJ family two-component response regulator
MPNYAHPKLYIIEDDPLVAATVVNLVRSLALETICFNDAGTFLQTPNLDSPACVLADVRLPGITGIALVRELNRRRIPIPVIVMTGFADVPTAVAAFREGAFNFIQKPFSGNELIEMINDALDFSVKATAVQSEKSEISARMNALNDIERALLPLLIEGRSNKEAALMLSLNHRTAERYRRAIFKKLGVRNSTELATLASKAP